MFMRVVVMLMAVVSLSSQAQTIKVSTAFAVICETKYAANFIHYDFVSHAATNAGTVTLFATRTDRNGLA